MALYAARGGNANSDLYILDPDDASETSVGSTGRAFTGLAFDPTDGTLYGSTSNNSPLNPSSLVTVNPTNGATTLVGGFGIGSALADIAFDSNGTLYGYSGTSHKLYTVNLATGAATQVSATLYGSYGYAMDFDASDSLFVMAFGDDLSPASEIAIVDQTDASHSAFSHISGSPPYGNGAALSAGTFVSDRVFYAIDNDFGASTHLVSIVIGSGEVTDIGSVTAGMDALASDTRATTAWAYTIAASDLINPDSPSASVVSGTCVQEDWEDWWDFGSNGYNLPEQTFKFTWAGVAGLYKLRITGHLSAGGSGSVTAVASVNGRPFLGAAGLGFSGTTTDSFFVYEGFDPGTDDVYDDVADYERNPWLVLSPGDLVEIQILSAADLTGFAGFNPFVTCGLRFDTEAPPTAVCTGAINFEDAPLGDDWGAVDGWGGQRLIPDEIYPLIVPAQPGPDDPHTPGVDFPWGVNQEDFDFVAMEDGTVYVFIHDSIRVSTDGTTPNNHRHFLAVKKYDPGGGTWSQVATLNIRTPADRYQAYGVTAETDGTFVYFAWWELTTFTAGSPNLYQGDWHLVRLDPSDDSTTELGTGQHSVTVSAGASNQSDNAELGPTPATLAPHILISGDDLYVGVVEMVRTAAGASLVDWRRPYVWRWNGSTWTELGVPTPSFLGPDATRWEVTGENGFWDQLLQMVAADQNGPISDGFTLVYSYIYMDADAIFRGPSVTIPYTTGGGWGTEILTDWSTLEAGRQATAIAPPDNIYLARLIDHTIMWSELEGKLVLAGDLLVGPDNGIWDTWVMNDDGDQWEIREPIAPASSAGGWRQSRNSAAIGPDGLIYRAMISDIVSINFEPHVLKHSPGYSFGYANAARKAIGKKDSWEDPQGNFWSGAYITMFGTTNFRIRWVGNSCYVMGNFYNEPQLVIDQLFADYGGDWPYGEGFYVIKGTYVPCTRFLPQIYRRVLG